MNPKAHSHEAHRALNLPAPAEPSLLDVAARLLAVVAAVVAALAVVAVVAAAVPAVAGVLAVFAVAVVVALVAAFPVVFVAAVGEAL